MQVSNNEYYGFYGQASNVYDEFLGFGKKAKKRRKERRARKKEKVDIRHERRRLKNDALRANTEAQRAQTSLTQSIVNPAPVQTTSLPATNNPSQVQAQALRTGQSLLVQRQPSNTNASILPPPADDPSDLLSSPIALGIGVVIVGGIIYYLHKTRQVPRPRPAVALAT